MLWSGRQVSSWLIRTPRWFGFIIQRPEAHAVHHARGVHAYNYGNVMLWDILLGTFRNPSPAADDEAEAAGRAREFAHRRAGADRSGQFALVHDLHVGEVLSRLLDIELRFVVTKDTHIASIRQILTKRLLT